MLEHDHSLTAYCANAFVCRHSAVLRLEMLVQRLGWEFDVVARRVELRTRLICSHCATNWPQLILSPRSARAGQGGAHDHARELTVEESTRKTLAFNRAAVGRDAQLGEPLPPTGKYRRRFGR